MSRGAQRARRGFALLPVVLMLGVLAAVAFAMTREPPLAGALLSGGAQADQARFVAEAGLAHALWRADASACAAYDLPDTPFGANSYRAVFDPSHGSPVAVEATATLASGAGHALRRDGVRVYEAATTTSLQPDASTGEDTYVDEWHPSWNYGAHRDLWVQGFAWSRSHALLRFDLAGIPGAARIASAVLVLYQNTPSGNGGPIGVHRVTADWVEGSRSGGSGPGATWEDRDTSLPWGALGGDFDATPRASATLPSGSVGFFEWDVTALVSDWVSGVHANHGLVLVPQSPATGAYFSSSDATDPARRPRLVVTWACECGTGPVETLALQPSAAQGLDAWITGGKPLWNYGAHPVLKAVESAPQRSVLAFDLSMLPAGAQVQQAQLGLYASRVQSAGAVDLHVVTDAWTEGTCLGSGCTADGVTWDTRDGVVPWATPGVDHQADATASQTVDTVGAWYAWDVSDAAAGWASGAVPNHGLLMRGHFGGVNADFESSDAADPALHPKLTLSYTCPCGGCGPPSGVAFYLDEFTAVAWDGSDGNLPWIFYWVESGDDGSPAGGKVRVQGGRAWLDGSGGGIKPSLARAVDLSWAPSASLSFELDGFGELGKDSVAIEASDDGGENFTLLEEIDLDGSVHVQRVYDLGAFVALTSDVVVRFRVSKGLLDTGHYVGFDDVRIGTGAPPAPLSTQVLVATADTYIRQDDPGDNFGEETLLRMGAPSLSGPIKRMHSLLRFDVGVLPPGATVDSAILRLVLDTVAGSGSIDVGAYRITADWAEASATWDNTGGGGTYDPTRLDLVSVPVVSGRVVEWQLPPGLIHEWIDGIPAPGTNYGVILVYEGSVEGPQVMPESREHETGAFPPRLAVRYAAP